MNIKILVITSILFLIMNTFNSSGIIKDYNDLEKINTTISEIKEVKIAIFSRATPFPTSNCYIKILNEYQWKVGLTHYKFRTIRIYENDIIRGDLKTENYDLFIIPAMEGEEEYTKLFFSPIKQIIWKKRIENFIKNGGGYIGYCFGSTVVSGFEGKPKTMAAKLLLKMTIGISKVKLINFENGLPFFDQLFGKPEMIGPAAYQWFSGYDITKDMLLCGAPLDVKINRDNPIFDDYLEENRRILWNSGPAFGISNLPNSDVKILAYYPDLNISKNVSTQIHAWKYIGGLLGFVKGFIEYRQNGNTISDSLYFFPYMAKDWVRTNKIIETHCAGKPFMTMEKYSNENQARIILCGGHPEYKVWWGGQIKEAEDTDSNNLVDGLHYWTNVTPFNQTPQDEITYNNWIVRRHVAWVARIPDNDLPPVYGPSQVNDIYPYEQTSNFNIYGNAEISEGIAELDLYYRHSFDNETWSGWKLYKTDKNGSDGWSWKFESPKANGSGYYQFYSLRHIKYEHEWLNETAPPGPDSSVYVNGI